MKVFDKQGSLVLVSAALVSLALALAARSAPAQVGDDASLTDYKSHANEVKQPDGNDIPLPSAKQLAFQDLELGLFIHFGLSTFTGQSSGDGKKLASMFNPTALDCEQWMEVAKSMGAKYVVLTARHEGGFCLWPSNTTEYSVKNSPWKGGKGDVIKEYVTAARKHGLKVGLYHSSWHDANQCPAGPLPTSDLRYFEGRPKELEAFTKLQLAQLTELLTNYGPISMIWFDHHGCPGAGAAQFWARVDDLVEKLQPDCMRFGPEYWISGGHSGKVDYPLWYGVNSADGTIHSRPLDSDSQHGNPNGKFYVVWEADCPFSGGWFYNGPGVLPVREMVERYYASVGRGANFLPNFAPDPRGLMPPQVVRNAGEFGDELNKRFGKKIKGAAGGDSIVLDLGEATKIERIVLMEDLEKGQKVAAFEVDAFADGSWKNVYKGETIGHKHIIQLAVETSKLRFNCTKKAADGVRIREFAAY